MNMLGALTTLAGKSLADTGGTFWMPPQASTYAADSDWLFYFIYAICLVFFVLVLALVIIFSWMYRYREGAPPQKPAPKHSTALELTWTFVPTVIVIIIFVYGFKGYLRVTVPPPNAYNITVTGSMWNWNFDYPDGNSDNVLHVPLNVPVLFTLNSKDVIHGFFMPAFRMKKDVVPGRFNRIWAEASVEGTYDIYCTQYCGDHHSTMRTKLIVESKADFEAYLNKLAMDAANGPPIDLGKKLYVTKGCMTCHSINGDKNTGPTWKNAYGHDVELADGSHMMADELYLKTMIRKSNNWLLKGFQPVMPPFAGILKENTHDVDHLVAYIESLSDVPAPPGSAMHPLGAASQPATQAIVPTELRGPGGMATTTPAQ